MAKSKPKQSQKGKKGQKKAASGKNSAEEEEQRARLNDRYFSWAWRTLAFLVLLKVVLLWRAGGKDSPNLNVLRLA